MYTKTSLELKTYSTSFRPTLKMDTKCVLKVTWTITRCLFKVLQVIVFYLYQLFVLTLKALTALVHFVFFSGKTSEKQDETKEETEETPDQLASLSLSDKMKLFASLSQQVQESVPSPKSRRRFPRQRYDDQVGS